MTDAPQQSRAAGSDPAGLVTEKLIAAAAEAGLAAAKGGDIGGIATDIAGAAAEQGRQLLSSARSQATGFADARKNDAAQSIADLANSLRDSGGHFDDRPNIQSFVGSAAEGLEQLADGIRQRSFAEIYADVESFARARPLAVGAATVAAGFLLARFIKSSSLDLAAEASELRRKAESAGKSAVHAAKHAASTTAA